MPAFEYHQAKPKGLLSTLYYLDPQSTNDHGILLLHGLGTNSSSWQLQMPVLIEVGFRPIIPDIPGFGKSTFTGRIWSIYMVGKIVAELMTSLEVTPLSVVGISMGGQSHYN